MGCCCYQEEEGACCQETAGPSGLCYWHDPAVCKNHPDDKARLEAYARAGGQLRGISLRRATLAGLNLAAAPCQPGFDLSHADLYRANLQGASLYKVNFQYASLLKADFRDANLHWCRLSMANLLGVKLQGARLEHMQLDRPLYQERMAAEAVRLGQSELARDYYEQAEEIYRDLRKATEHEGLFALSGQYIQQELRMRRFQLPKNSKARAFSWLIDIFCGYGEEPARVVLFSLLLIFVSAVGYFFTGIFTQGVVLQFHSAMTLAEASRLFLTCLYYSVVTFTTLGYGDITPVGLSRLFAAFEAFTGSFTIALFVVVFVKKMTR
jgi:hypothetical protein